MTKILIVIPDELNTRLRHKVLNKYGLKKGDISRAICEAIELWLQCEESHEDNRIK